MFGYIKVDQANLLGKEYEAYKGVYCALCKQLGRDYSVFARFILSYDCTFYALLALDIAEKPPCYTQGRCRFNPFKKCSYAQSDTKALSLASALSVISAYYKLRDNLLDSPWYKRMLYRLIQPFFARWRRKAAKHYPDIDDSLSRMLASQIAAENDPDCILDRAAEPTAKMLSEMCSLLPGAIPTPHPENADKQKRVLGAFGYYLGRWIYLIDAADDFEKDQKSSGFNPFLLPSVPQNDLYGYVKATLNHALSEALLSYGLLDKGRFDPIIQNVLYISCVNIQNKVAENFQHTEPGGSNEKSL